MCYLGGEEERCWGDSIAVELREGMERVEPMHVHYRCVDA